MGKYCLVKSLLQYLFTKLVCKKKKKKISQYFVLVYLVKHDKTTFPTEESPISSIFNSSSAGSFSESDIMRIKKLYE